jgi:hypothetical protein
MKKTIITISFIALILLIAEFWWAVATLPWPIVVALYGYMAHILVMGFLEIAVATLVIPLAFYLAHNIVNFIRSKRK